MSRTIYQVDAFAEKPFTGNPAAVCILDSSADDAWMQSVAMEMNLSETAFVTRRADGDFDLRWFTPVIEVELCGHATLATSHVLYEIGILPAGEVARYHTQSGLLLARAVDGAIELDFPATPTEAGEAPDELLSSLGIEVADHVGRSQFDYMVAVGSAQIVRELSPNFGRLLDVDARGVIVTAASDIPEFDFISRFFGPAAGIDEDPVTGSAHCALTPYWASVLGKTELRAYQASARGGTIRCTLAGERVKLTGRAMTVLRGELFA